MMNKVRIRTMNDLKVARSVYRYESAMYDRAMLSSLYRFKYAFKTSLKNSCRLAAERAIIAGINRLIAKNI